MTVVGESEGQKPAVEPDQEKKDENAFKDMESATPIPPERTSDGVKRISEPPVGVESSIEKKMQINRETYTKEDLVITPEEKRTFVDALVSNSRWIHESSIFGGKIKVTLRSRTRAETDALYAYIRHELSRGDESLSLLQGDMAFILLVAHVAELNGTKFPEMKAPLTYTEEGGLEKEPGWIEDLQNWKKRPIGITDALINRIQLFEYKYWAMVSEASNSNFWTPDTSAEA